jgi:hypothetical protein
VAEERVGHGLAVGAQLGYCSAQRDRVPEDDGGDSAMESGSAVALVLEGAGADLPVAMEAQGAGEGLPGLACMTSRKGVIIL